MIAQTLRNVFFFTSLCIVVAGWTFFLLYGRNGRFSIALLQTSLHVEQHRVERLRKNINLIEKEVVAWRQDNFKREKKSRRELQFVYPGQILYHVI